MGKLIIVPTPIGNLKDMTYRAVDILQKADIILAEDTRTSSFLLKHFGIDKKPISHHKFNEHQTVDRISEWVLDGKNVALISDAGTPGISDPGFLLVKTCIEKGIEIEILPGATALIPALINSGFPIDRFCFEGFLPVKKGRRKKFESIKNEERTIVFYESPYRVLKTLKDIGEYFGYDRQVSVSRELTKIYEETIRGSVLTVIDHFSKNDPRGEFVITVAGKSKTINN